MDNVSLFVKTIIAITFMWSVAEVVLPDNSMQKYSSFIYGLVIISLTISIFTQMEFDDLFNQSNISDVGQYNNEYLKKLYEDKLEDALVDKFGDSSLDVELTDEFKIKNVKCKKQQTYDDIMRYINE